MNSFASLVELIQAMTHKLKCDTIQNLNTKNTRKKIVKIEIIIMVVTQNVKILKDCIKVQEKKRKSLSCVHVRHKM